MSNAAPEGWHTVTPRLFVDDVAAMVDFLRRTFAATGSIEASAPSVIRVGDSILMISSTEFRAPMPACLYVYVDDADAACDRARDAGARSLESVRDTPYGDRRGIVEDRWGNVWQIATPQNR